MRDGRGRFLKRRKGGKRRKRSNRRRAAPARRAPRRRSYIARPSRRGGGYNRAKAARRRSNRTALRYLLAGGATAIATKYGGDMVIEAVPVQDYLGVSIVGWAGLGAVIMAWKVFSHLLVKDVAYAVGTTAMLWEVDRQLDNNFGDIRQLMGGTPSLPSNIPNNANRGGRQQSDTTGISSGEARRRVSQISDPELCAAVLRASMTGTSYP